MDNAIIVSKGLIAYCGDTVLYGIDVEIDAACKLEQVDSCGIET